MAGVRLKEIAKSFGATDVLKGVSLDITAGGFTALLGPSGCGKSTLLRIIAGLETQDGGSVVIDDRAVDRLRPTARDVAMVFQTYALYPHMTVAQNMALPLKMRHMTSWQRLPLLGGAVFGNRNIRNTIDTTVREAAAALEINHLLDRKPSELSGGQRQRVALGRAMVRRPKVFLMDEPLSNLDAKLRVQMRAEIKELHRQLGITFIYVTHDQAEAMTMADQVAVMMDGELLQVAPPRTIYAAPADIKVATFIGSPQINLLSGISRHDGAVDVPTATLAPGATAPSGAKITVGMRPENLSLADAAGPGNLTGTVRTVEDLGTDLFLHLEIHGAADLVIVRADPARRDGLGHGATVHVSPRPDTMLLFDANGKRLAPATTRPNGANGDDATGSAGMLPGAPTVRPLPIANAANRPRRQDPTEPIAESVE